MPSRENLRQKMLWDNEEHQMPPSKPPTKTNHPQYSQPAAAEAFKPAKPNQNSRRCKRIDIDMTPSSEAARSLQKPSYLWVQHVLRKSRWLNQKRNFTKRDTHYPQQGRDQPMGVLHESSKRPCEGVFAHAL